MSGFLTAGAWFGLESGEDVESADNVMAWNPLTGYLPRPSFAGDVTFTDQTSTDLQTWTDTAVKITPSGNQLAFPLPGGQTWAFYRMNVSPSF